jgi:hypothetical protein
MQNPSLIPYYSEQNSQLVIISNITNYSAVKLLRLIATLFYVSLVIIPNPVIAQNCCVLELKNGRSLETLGKEYQRLRLDKKTSCCDNFGSGLMEVMIQLNDSVSLGITQNKIISIMGIPDIIATNKEPLEHHFTNLGINERVLIYCWRGLHDFLYFEFKNDKLINKNWYYAGE